ncbi:MAG: TraY domain-containing protein [Dongiaceae bacterium]
MTGQRKRAGRPTKAAPPGTRASLGLKVTADTKRRLEEAAKASGRTQSQEAEARLERSFDFDAALGGPQIADLVKAIGHTMSAAGALAFSLATGKSGRDGRWLSHPYAFNQAVQAAHRLIEASRPAGEIVVPSVDWPGPPKSPAEAKRLLTMLANLGRLAAEGQLSTGQPAITADAVKKLGEIEK